MLKGFLLPLVIAIASLPLGAKGSFGGPLTFTSPIGFINSLGQPLHDGVRFNDFTADTSFQNSTLDVGPLSLSSTGPAHIGLNKIEVNPVLLELITPNSTPYAALYLKTSDAGNTTVTLSFDQPIFGFGASYRGIRRDTVISYTTASGDHTIVPGITSRFFGFILDTGEFISSLTYSAPVENGFGIDDILLSNAVISSAAAAPVDEPSSFFLTLMAFLGLGWFLRKHRAQG